MGITKFIYIFAVALLFKLPFLYYAFLRFKKFIRYYSLILIFLITFCLVIISTRSSFIGLFLQLTVLSLYGAFYLVRSKNLKTIFNHAKPYLLIVIIALLGFFLGDAFLKYNFEQYGYEFDAYSYLNKFYDFIITLDNSIKSELLFLDLLYLQLLQMMLHIFLYLLHLLMFLFFHQ